MTEDHIAVLVAAYRTLAGWVEPAYPQRSKDAFCVGEMIGLNGYLRDPAPSVMERLAAADPRFVNGSACRLGADIRMHQGFPPLVFYLTGASDWGWPLLVSNVTWQDGIATTTVALSYSVPDTRGYTCRWEKADGGWRLLSCSGGWIS